MYSFLQLCDQIDMLQQKFESFTTGEKIFLHFGMGISKMCDKRQNLLKWGGGGGGGQKRRERGEGRENQHFLKKLKEETYLGGHCDLEF